MSLTVILASGLFDLLCTQSAQTSSAAANPSGTSVQNEFQQLGQDLKSGNVSAARQDFATVEQGVRQRTAQILHHHHHFSAAGSSSSTSTTAQDFGELAQALQSGNVSAAQTAFAALQQAMDQPYASTSPNAAAAASEPGSSNAVNFLV
jgi:hypothetical protein